MTNKVCLVERVGNQGTSYPEINAVKACKNAGASAVIVYSNLALPGLQNPFLVDANNEANLVSVSVDRATGLALRNQIGASVTVSNQGNKDYEYYNGTSMATPHVSGVATLVWSYHPECSAAQVRNALKMTAEDLGTAGRDNYYGYGLVNAVAAKTFLDASCDGPTDPVDPTPTDGVLVNGVAKTGLTGAASEELHFSFDVPQGATNLGFVMNGGTGDADLYVQYGAAPTTSNYDCRPYKSGNSESCPITNVQSGTYYAMVKGYSAFSGVSLTASYTASTGGGTPPTTPADYINADNYNIPDNKTTGITSPITVTRTGNSGTVTTVVNIVHPYIGDLKVQLVSPTGQIATLHSNSGGSADNINKSYTVDMTGVESSGVWMLKAVDSGRGDIGYIDSWELKFQ
jgi:serine protease